MRIAHRLGLSSSATMMFGHVESIDDRIEHLRRLRDVQDETGGYTAFICWTFQSDGTKMRNIPPTGSHEYLRMQALSRIFLDNFDNVQSELGHARARRLARSPCSTARTTTAA